jgi:short-subunit dehydrogenase
MTILIIGATSGIGYALAQEYARAGWTVGATGRRLELLETLRQSVPEGKIHIRKHDVTAPDNIAVIEDLARECGGADVVVYNSGTGVYNKNMEFELEKQTIDVNLMGFVEVATWAYRSCRAGGSPSQLVGVSSIAGHRGGQTVPAYHASKAFMHIYMESLRMKARRFKMPFFVTDIRPGFVKTPMTAKNKGMFWVVSPEKAARQIRAAITGKRRVAYISKRWALVAFLFKIFPRGWFERAGGLM